MNPAAPVISVRTPYDERVTLVTDVLTRNSVTTAAQARRLAVEVLHALDHMPERVR